MLFSRRMMLQNVLHPELFAYVGIDFGGEDTGVAEHVLHNPEVCSVFYQMGCK